CRDRAGALASGRWRGGAPAADRRRAGRRPPPRPAWAETGVDGTILSGSRREPTIMLELFLGHFYERRVGLDAMLAGVETFDLLFDRHPGPDAGAEDPPRAEGRGERRGADRGDARGLDRRARESAAQKKAPLGREEPDA